MLSNELEEGLLHNNNSDDGGVEVTTAARWTVAEMKAEAWKLGKIAGPMVVVTLSQYGLQVISLMMVGHIGELELSSAAIATSLSGVTGFSLLLGLASGLETLCGQAFGAKQYHKLGLHLYRAIFVLLLFCVPITIIWIYMEELLILVGQDPQISREAGKYAMWMIPALFAYATTQPLMRFLQSQSLTLPMLLSAIATLCLHIPLSWILVYKSSLRNVGAALALGISYWLNASILGFYIKYSTSCKATRAPFSIQAFKGINEFLRLAVPSAVMICLEWWSYELLVLLSGLLPNPELEMSVLSVCLTSISTLYSIPYGLGAAASTRVSNELGAGNAKGARFAMLVVMVIAATEALLLSGTLLGFRSVIGYAYSNEEEVVDYVKAMVPLVSISVILDNLQGVLSGVARGCGWQHVGAFVNLGAFYLAGIPVAIVLGFLLHIGGRGLWFGIVVGATVQTGLLALITSFTNWQKQADKAKERVFKLPKDNSLK